jgi:hypothetical protein
MSQSIVKDLRNDLRALAKRQEAFEDKILNGTATREDTEFFKATALAYADEARKVRQKIMDLLSDPNAGTDDHDGDNAPAEQVQ